MSTTLCTVRNRPHRSQPRLGQMTSAHHRLPEMNSNPESLPSHIVVAGKTRPTSNSLGHPIHQHIAAIERFWLWAQDQVCKDNQGRPLVLFHGTRSTSTFDMFIPGGANDSATCGDSLGLATYLTTCPSEASQHSRDQGQVIAAYAKGNLLHLPLDPHALLAQDQAAALTTLAKQWLSPSDRSRFQCGRIKRHIADRREAQAFFEACLASWSEFGDGMCRARPEVLEAGPSGFVIEYTNYQASVHIASSGDAKTLFKTIGWESASSIGLDGIMIEKESAPTDPPRNWLVMYQPMYNLKSVYGNSGAYSHQASLIDHSDEARPRMRA